MSVPVTNFGKVTVSIGYDASATSIVLTGGHGSRLPSTFPFPLSWWDATTYSDPADDPNREIVTVTNRVTDTLTITRASEGTSASTKNTGSKTYKMVLGLTKAMYDQLFTLSLTQSFRGLSMQTHPDSDVALKSVQLLHADAIVMNDGQEIQAWDDLTADITTSGAGGLDTGAEAASTWYELYAIYNPSTTTKKLMLHRAKDYFLDEDITAGEDASQGVRSAVDNSTVKVAQGFKVDTSGLLEFVDVKLLKTGTPTGNFWFTVEATSGGVPSNTPLATSDKYDVARLTTTSIVVRMPFRVPASLSAATQYHLVMQGDWAVSAANFANWRMDGSAATYANGSKALFDSDTTTWTNDTDDDMYAKIYITRNDTAVTQPSGYTQQAKIGYVYNNASSNFKFFSQVDRHVSQGGGVDWQIGAFGAVTQLVDLAAFSPPIPVAIVLQMAQVTGAGSLSLGSVQCTDINVANSIGGVAVTAPLNSTVSTPLLSVTAYQGIVVNSGAATATLYLVLFKW